MPHRSIVRRVRSELAALTGTDRVRKRTAGGVRARLDERMLARLRRDTAADPRQLARRMAELDRQWDIERALEGTAAALALAGLGLGLGVDRRFLWMPAIAVAFFLQQVSQGWCPPAAILRRLGVRTRQEIDTEKYALKTLRGDFTAA